MKGTLGWLLGAALMTWAAVAADPEPGSRDSSRPPAATRPATSPARPTGAARSEAGPRPRRLLDDGNARRDGEPMVPPGSLGRRGSGGPPGPGGPRPPMGPEEPLSAEQIEQIMRFARETFPQIHDRLERLRQVEPAAFNRVIRRLGVRFLEILETQRRDPKRARQMIEDQRSQLAIADLSRKYHQARSDEERARIRGQIENRLRERFQRQQERSRREIEDLRRRLDEQARKLNEREQNRDDILRKELRRALYGPPPGERDEGASR